MKIQLMRNVRYLGIPKGCRKPRTMYREQVFPVELKEMSAKDFPLAYTVHMEDRFAPGEGRHIHVPFRADGESLFCEFRMIEDARLPVEKATDESVAYYVCQRVVDYAAEDDISEYIRNMEESVRLYNGHLWYRTDEPVYTLDTAHFIFSDSPYLLIVNWDVGRGGACGDSIYGDHVYRADERDLVVQRMKNYIAKKKEKCPSSEKVKELEDYIMSRLESDYIEIGDVFVTRLDDEKTRRMKRQKEEVQEHLLKDVFSSYHMPSEEDDDCGVIAELREDIRKKLFGETGAETEGKPVYTAEFYKAFFEELRELVLYRREHEGMSVGPAN